MRRPLNKQGGGIPLTSNDPPAESGRPGLQRRALLRGSLIAGAGSVALSACGTNGLTSGASNVTESTGGQFVSATNFVTSDNRRIEIRSKWPAIDFARGASDAITSFGLPAGASVVSVAVLWISDQPGPGEVRWASGVDWAQSDLAVDSDVSRAPWQYAVARVAESASYPVTTKIGDFMVNHNSTSSRIQIARQSSEPEDTFSGDVHLLGIKVEVLAVAPLG